MNVCRLRLIVHCPDVPVQIQIKRRAGQCAGHGGDITRELLFGKLRSSDQAAPGTGQTPTQLQYGDMHFTQLF